jgi:hypothetical protein
MERRFGWLRALTPAGSGEDEGTKGVAVFSDPSGMVDSARAVAHRHSEELHMAARVSTIVDQNSP